MAENKNNEKEERAIDDRIIEKIEPSQEDFISRRVNHIPSAKVICWLDFRSKKDSFVYASELADFMKYSQTRAYGVLREFCNVGILHRKYVGNLVEFHFMTNGNRPIINKYIEKARKTLGLG